MKSKTANKLTVPCTKTDEDVALFTGEVHCQGPNEFLYKFEGNMKFKPAKDEFLESETDYNGGMTSLPIDVNQVLLRGSSLRNTDYVYGIVIYTGHESKIMKNSPKTRNKLSRIEQKTNFLIVALFFVELVIIGFAATFSTIWNHTNYDNTDQYLRWNLSNDPIDNSVILTFLINLGSWMLVFVAFVPISLIVTLEMVKFSQAIIITWDESLFDETKDMPAKVQSSNLNEELGQIEYIFSDKTGTLTQNIMEFKKMSIGGYSYGKSSKES